MVFALLGLIFFRPLLSSKIKNFLGGSEDQKTSDSLVFENQNLKAEIAQLKEIVNRTPREGLENYEFGFVYARYPFNVKSEVLVNIGSRQNVAKGKSVLFGAYDSEEIGRSVLFGEVKEVFEQTSLVETIFGNNWRSEVRVGDQQTLAVLEGGATPKLRLISKEAPILDGDVVYNADERFPLGIAIGYIKDVEMSSDHLFKEANLDIPYDLAGVGVVLVGR